MKHTKATKKKLSKIRKKYLKENPDKHPWKKSNKFKSVPCEKFKDILRENNVSFLEEYQPISDRFFSIDIAFPNKKIGIEINGNQHYERDGKLKKYYEDRKKLIENEGWKLFDYHYSIAYDVKMCEDIISTLKKKYDLGKLDYSFYIKKKKQHECADCGGERKYYNSSRCKKCSDAHNGFKRRTVERPPHEELLKLVEENSYLKVGRMFNVSDNAIRKWIKAESNK